MVRPPRWTKAVWSPDSFAREFCERSRAPRRLRMRSFCSVRGAHQAAARRPRAQVMTKHTAMQRCKQTSARDHCRNVGEKTFFPNTRELVKYYQTTFLQRTANIWYMDCVHFFHQTFKQSACEYSLWNLIAYIDNEVLSAPVFQGSARDKGPKKCWCPPSQMPEALPHPVQKPWMRMKVCQFCSSSISLSISRACGQSSAQAHFLCSQCTPFERQPSGVWCTSWQRKLNESTAMWKLYQGPRGAHSAQKVPTCAKNANASDKNLLLIFFRYLVAYMSFAFVGYK